MNTDQRLMTTRSLKQALEALHLVLASINAYVPFNTAKKYTPEEREPYDAMCDRFIRAIEICIKFFRSYELMVEGVNSETIRDMLNKMERLGFISSTLTWMEMRDVRNRIVHDYLPEDVERIYKSITGEFGKEILRLKENLENTDL